MQGQQDVQGTQGTQDMQDAGGRVVSSRNQRMKYLFGDSASFPHDFNFLTTLEAFMTSATAIVELELRGQISLEEASFASSQRNRTLERLETFHTQVLGAITTAAAHVAQGDNSLPEAREYAQKLSEHASLLLSDHKRVSLSTSERELANARSESERTRSEIARLLEVFFKASELPQSGAELSVRLAGVSHEATAVFSYDGGIESSFSIDAARTPAWGHPRRVSEFCTGLTLQVGIKKSWLKGTVSTEKILLDEWTLGEIDLDASGIRISLRKKATERDMLVLQFATLGGGSNAVTVEHPGSPNGESLPTELDQEDAELAKPFAQAVRGACLELLAHKAQLSYIKLDGIDARSTGASLIPLVERIVAMLAPTVHELTRRSPSPLELSLKRESADGRREELYLRKEELTRKLQPLPAAGRAVFAPLGLDTWVPGVTQAPPNVM
jgi:hypothetical protein